MNPTLEKATETAASKAAAFNPDKQHTIKKSASISGTGLHTGVLASITLKPAEPGFGLQFQRTDLPDIRRRW